MGHSTFLGITCEGACLTKEYVAAAAPQQQNPISALIKQLSQVQHPHNLQAQWCLYTAASSAQHFLASAVCL